MQSILSYIRNLLGVHEEVNISRSNFKRERTEDEFSMDDDPPSLKRLKNLNKTNFPNIMSSNDVRNNEDYKEKPSKNVRYVPIQIESGHPSTSTPYEIGKVNRFRNVPVKFVHVTENGPSTPSRKPRMHTPIRPVVIDDEDDDDNEVTLVEKIPDNHKKAPKVYMLDDEDDTDKQDDVIFVKKISSPPPVKPYKYFITNDDESKDNESVQFYKLSKVNERNSAFSPRSFSKFKAPAGITKAYKKPTTTLPRWMQPVKTTNLLNSSKNKVNGNMRTTLAEVFNLDEKRNYQELIKKVTGASISRTASRPTETINLVDNFASFRLTQRDQKNSLNEIKLTEKGLSHAQENDLTTEYDPITVASITSSDSEVEIVPSESSSSSVRIEQINTLKDSFRDKPIILDDWLSKLDKKYKLKKHYTQELVDEEKRRTDIISKVNKEQKLAHLEHKLKHELSIPESLFEEPQPTVELPELTPEQEKLVSRSIGPGPSGQLLVEKFNLRIHRRDLQTLSGLNWLNDEVINFYMNLLMQRSEERKDLPKVYATNTFFYPKLMQSGQSGLRRWTRKIDIFAHDLMVIPVHLGVHWCLSLIDFRDKKISYLDSMGGKNHACLNALRQYLKDEHQDKKGQPFDDSGWKAECLKDIPQQMNGSDCGMFACTFAEFSARNAPYTFNQSHMPYLRRKAALEILMGKLLL